MKKIIYSVLLLTILIPNISLFSGNTSAEYIEPLCDLLPVQN